MLRPWEALPPEPRSAWEETAPVTSHMVLRCRGGSRRVVAIIVITVMELVFEAKILIILMEIAVSLLWKWQRLLFGY